MGWWSRLWHGDEREQKPSEAQSQSAKQSSALFESSSRSSFCRRTRTGEAESRRGWVEVNGHRRPMTDAEMDAAMKQLDASMAHLDRSMEHLDRSMADLDASMALLDKIDGKG